MIFPIQYAISESKIIKSVPEKERYLATVIPGKLETYVFTNEKDYHKDYQKSLFAITHKKCGWDCMRHYEILANGCIPVFKDLHQCPNNIMTLFPKEYIIDLQSLCKNDNLILNKNEYKLHIEYLLNYTRQYLTTEHLAKYVLEKSNNQICNRILILTTRTGAEYLKDMLIIGFKELLKQNCHDFPMNEYIYHGYNLNQYNKKQKKQNRIMTVAHSLDPTLQVRLSENQITSHIRNKYYDIILYPDVCLTDGKLPYYNLVKEQYEYSKIILVCGMDGFDHKCPFAKSHKHHPLFVRELYPELYS